jgi:hypothetical protein
MAQYLTPSQARSFEVNGREFDLIALISTDVPDGWISPESVTELKLGQIAYVHALGGFRRGVVAKIGRTKVTVVFTTKGAVDDSRRAEDYHRARSTERAGEPIRIRVADTAVQLSCIKIPAPARKPSTEEAPVAKDQDDQLTPTPATENTDAPAPPIVTGDMTGSAVVKLMEEVWDRIRENHPELPAVIIVTGTGMIGPSRWGHFRADGWTLAKAQGETTTTNLALGEMFMAGETLAKGARQVLQTMIHEAAHVLAQVRTLKDTSRQGRWHNTTFRTLAEEMGLEHKAATAHTQHGFSFVTLTEQTEAKYADLLDELEAEIRLVVDLPWFLKGTEKPAGEEAEGGEYIHGGRKRTATTTPQSGNLKATCTCSEPNIIRISRKVLDKQVVSCDDCDSIFTA